MRSALCSGSSTTGRYRSAITPGFAPFGFGYRRCPGEQLTLMAFEDLLRKAQKDKLSFVKIDNPASDKLPIGPNTVISDDLGFTRPA